MTHAGVSVARRRAAAATLALVLLGGVVAACDGPQAPAPHAADRAADDWDDDAAPPTRDEILTHAAEHSADEIAEALVEVAAHPEGAPLFHVVALASDEREEIRWHAALALKAIGGDEASATLARLAAHDPSELVRGEAAHHAEGAAR